MTGPEVAEDLESLAATLRLQRGSVDGLTLDVGESGVKLVIPSAGARRQRKWRRNQKGETVSETVSESVSEASPRASPDRLDDRNETVSPSVSEASRSPFLPPAPPLQSPDFPKALNAASEGPVRSRARYADAAPEAGKQAAVIVTPKRDPRNLEDALELEPQARAEYLLARKGEKDLVLALQAHMWPEVRMPMVSYRDAVGKPNLPIGQYFSDDGVRALVDLLAAGVDCETLCGIIPEIVRSDFWQRATAPLSLSSITVSVVRRHLEQHGKGPSDFAKGIISTVERGGSPEPLGGTLTRLAAGGGG